MKLKQFPELLKFFSTSISDASPERDQETVQAFIRASTPANVELVLTQVQALLASSELPLEEFGSEANRWFGEEAEAKAWLESLATGLKVGLGGSSDSVIVKDSNGTPLAEGDAVQVIKDLKVKGGSSDLKRGTLIKKIHLVGDPDVIECRVDGSTLVLKTCFLKKA